MRSRVSSFDGQTVLDSDMHAALGPLHHLHSSNCLSVHVADEFAARTSDGDVRAALLQFMIAATPNDVNDILSKYDEYLEGMTVGPIDHLTSSDEPSLSFIDNVPDTVNPVRASMGWIQVPGADGTSTDLKLVWRVSGVIISLEYF